MNRDAPRLPERPADDRAPDDRTPDDGNPEDRNPDDRDADLFEASGDPVLSAGSLRLLEGHLMSEIDAVADPLDAPATHPAPRSRRTSRRTIHRRLAWVAAPVTALAVAATIALYPSDGGGRDFRVAPEGKPPLTVVKVLPGSTKNLAAVVDRISLAADTSSRTPRPDQYLYVESTTANAVFVGNETAYVGERHTRRVWATPDGRQLLVAGGPGPEIWRGDNPNPYVGDPTYDFLAALPRDPDALLARIHAETEGQGSGVDAQAFTTIGDMIREQVLPPGLAGAVYRTAARIPGVVVVPESTDALGRTGIALARADDAGGDRTEWIFDRDTYAFLGERTVLTRAVNGLAVGTVTGLSAVVKQTIVDTVPGDQDVARA
ncbi:CU044_5270 family protein [Streptomyces sp. SID3343]|uniref:CU044_5270 family protein n=1 Tax=Streptomyces sp. SID3343 TaxID=2690260 RepID=UPI0013712558|nr:CU044_5270 family protein [Streptomyces sp. SID3343]MYW02898.1 hypothetical protein [Streptomyces sp. SID3343]